MQLPASLIIIPQSVSSHMKILYLTFYWLNGRIFCYTHMKIFKKNAFKNVKGSSLLFFAILLFSYCFQTKREMNQQFIWSMRWKKVAQFFCMLSSLCWNLNNNIRVTTYLLRLRFFPIFLWNYQNIKTFSICNYWFYWFSTLRSSVKSTINFSNFFISPFFYFPSPWKLLKSYFPTLFL